MEPVIQVPGTSKLGNLSSLQVRSGPEFGYCSLGLLPKYRSIEDLLILRKD